MCVLFLTVIRKAVGILTFPLQGTERERLSRELPAVRKAFKMNSDLIVINNIQRQTRGKTAQAFGLESKFHCKELGANSNKTLALSQMDSRFESRCFKSLRNNNYKAIIIISLSFMILILGLLQNLNKVGHVSIRGYYKSKHITSSQI